MRREYVKSILSILTLLFLPILTALPVYADIISTINGLVWTVDAHGNLISVAAEEGVTVSGAVEIPSSVTDNLTGEKRDIIRLGSPTPADNKLFFGNTEITKVIIPEGITEISDGYNFLTSGVFNGCSNLLEVELPSTLKKIGNDAFYNCSKLEKMDIPSGVSVIGGDAFGKCVKLQTVTIPEGVTTIASSAFDYCAGLKNIFLPRNLQSINASSFRYCTSLTVVELPETIESIGLGAFLGCTALMSINFPASLKSIGNNAFENTALTTVEFPNVPVLFGSQVFLNCANLESVQLPGDGSSAGGLFPGCSKLETVKLHPGSTEIWKAAFSSSSIKSIEIPKTVTRIGEGAFSGCFALEEILLHDEIESIGPSAFMNSGLTSFMFPDNEKFDAIPNSLLSGTKITEVTIPKSITKVSGSFVQNCSKLKNIVWLTDSVQITSNILFNGCLELENLEFPNPTGISNLAIGTDAFKECIKLKEFTVPVCVVSLNAYALRNSSLEKITFLSNKTTFTNENSVSYLKDKAKFYIPTGNEGVRNSLDTIIAAIDKGYNFKYTDTILGMTAQDDTLITFTNSNLDVTFDSASKYGFVKSAYKSEITALDVLVAAHAAKYGWTDAPGDQLVINSSGSVTKSFGADVAGYGFSVNGEEKPIASLGGVDGEEDTFINRGDRVHFFHKPGESKYFKLSVKGETYQQEIALIPDYSHTLVLTDSDGGLVTDNPIPIYTLNLETGALSEEPIGFINENGEATVTFAENGRYALVAWDMTSQSFILNFLIVNVDAPNNKINVTGVTGDPAFIISAPLSSGYLAGAFVKTGEEGFLSEGFDPTHMQYNLYVNRQTNAVTFAIIAEAPALNPLLSVSVDGIETVTDREAASGAWTQSVTLNGDTTKVVLSVKGVDNGIIFTRPYAINVVKEGSTPFAGIIGATDHGRTYYYDGEYKQGAASLSLLVHKDQTEAELEVAVMPGTEVYVGETKAAGVKQAEFSSTADRSVYLAKFDASGLIYDNQHRADVTRKLITYRKDGTEETTKEFTVSFRLRSPNEGVFTPDRFIEYSPAKGNFVIQELTRTPLVGYTYYGKFVSLGILGGYATYYYNDPIFNDPKNLYGVDFIVYGNSFEGGSPNEPAGAQVSYDGETWYYLAGQRHYELETRYLTNVPLLDGKTTESLLILQKGEFSGYGGYPNKVDWGYADVANCSIIGNATREWSVDARPYNPYQQGAVTSYAKGGNVGDMFDLSWIVDRDGVPVNFETVLPDGIRYIKLQNVMDVQDNPPFGDMSPELGTITRVNPQFVKATDAGVTPAPSAFTVNGISILDDGRLAPVGRNTYYLDGFDLGGMDVRVNITGASENDNIYVNKEAYYGGYAEYTGTSDDDDDSDDLNGVLERKVRVVIQNGESEPRIYVVKCVNGGDPAENAGLLSVNMNPDNVKLNPESGGNYIGTVINEVSTVALNVRALNPESAITLTGDGIDETGVALAHDEFSNVTLGYTFPVKVGRNNFTVTIESKNGNNRNEYPVEITRRPPQYGVPQLDAGTGNSGNTAAGTVIGGVEFEDLTTAIASAGNAPKMEGVSLAEAGAIKIDLAANGGDADSAIYDALGTGGALEGLDGMLENGVIAVDGDGNIVADADAALGKMTSEERARYGKTAALPAVTAEVGAPSGSGCKTAALVYRDVFGEFTDAPAGDIDVFKLTTEDEIRRFEPAQSLENILPGESIITDGLGNKIPPEAKLAGDELLIIAIEDNSDLDWDRDSGEIADPPIVAQKINNGGSDPGGNDPGGSDPGGNDPSGGDGDDYTGSGAGGCNAGLGAGGMSALALFALVLAAAFRRKAE
jgi:hypothetical protein